MLVTVNNLINKRTVLTSSRVHDGSRTVTDFQWKIDSRIGKTWKRESFSCLEYATTLGLLNTTQFDYYLLIILFKYKVWLFYL